MPMAGSRSCRRSRSYATRHPDLTPHMFRRVETILFAAPTATLHVCRSVDPVATSETTSTLAQPRRG